MEVLLLVVVNFLGFMYLYFILIFLYFLNFCSFLNIYNCLLFEVYKNLFLKFIVIVGMLFVVILFFNNWLSVIFMLDELFF